MSEVERKMNKDEAEKSQANTSDQSDELTLKDLAMDLDFLDPRFSFSSHCHHIFTTSFFCGIARYQRSDCTSMFHI